MVWCYINVNNTSGVHVVWCCINIDNTSGGHTVWCYINVDHTSGLRFPSTSPGRLVSLQRHSRYAPNST